jgi:hypothetical protein
VVATIHRRVEGIIHEVAAGITTEQRTEITAAALPHPRSRIVTIEEEIGNVADEMTIIVAVVVVADRRTAAAAADAAAPHRHSHL